MEQEPYFLDELRRTIVLRTIREVARHRRWKLWASHVRTNHVHLFVTAPDKPEKVMADFKAWASRRLREAFDESVGRNRWTQHGSTRWLNDTIALDCSVAYVVDEQGETMACYDGRIAAEEPDA